MAPAAVWWEYRVLLVKNPDVGVLEKRLVEYGRAGWELVEIVSTVKTWVNLSGNDLVVVFKRPTDQPADLDYEPTFGEIDPATGLAYP
jgi:hypothetical protein